MSYHCPSLKRKVSRNRKKENMAQQVGQQFNIGHATETDYRYGTGIKLEKSSSLQMKFMLGCVWHNRKQVNVRFLTSVSYFQTSTLDNNALEYQQTIPGFSI